MRRSFRVIGVSLLVFATAASLGAAVLWVLTADRPLWIEARGPGCKATSVTIANGQVCVASFRVDSVDQEAMNRWRQTFHQPEVLFPSTREWSVERSTGGHNPGPERVVLGFGLEQFTIAHDRAIFERRLHLCFPIAAAIGVGLVPVGTFVIKRCWRSLARRR